jgi:predicted NBD/HSP70 family sugar kinase
MYLAIDVGGTKTLVASLTNQGVIKEEFRFPTPPDYHDFLKELTAHVDKLSTDDFKACGIGIPGIIDHKRGRGVSFGHLKWHDVPVQHDVEKIAKCPVVLENDAKLAGLSEAMLVKQHRRVLYVTVSTGIGTGYIVDQRIDPELSTNEGGHIMLEHQGKYKRWEDFAAGSAIVRQFGKPMSDINDERTLRIIARNIAIGMIDLIAVLTPDVIVIGGSVGTHYAKYADYLQEYLEKFDNPMIQLPVIKAAERPEKAVVYGCYDAAKQFYG